MKKSFPVNIATTNVIKVTIIGIGLILFAYLSYTYKVFTTIEISCQLNQGGSCDEPVEAELNHLQNTFFFSPNISKTAQKIIQSDPYIADIDIKKTFPHSIKFIVKKKKPLIEIKCVNHELLVNIDGKVDENIQQLQLNIPVIPAQPLICDTMLNQERINLDQLQVIAHFFQQVKTADPEFSTLWEDERSVSVFTALHQHIILPIDQMEQKYQMYQYLLEQHELPDEWSTLDLRFQKAIVKTQ